MKGRANNKRRMGWLRAVVLALPLLTSCVVSPQPSPPVDEPELDGGGIGVIGNAAEDFNQLLTFEAQPGTVVPADGVVVATNLDRTDAPSTVAVRADGSFAVALTGLPGHTVRFQVEQDSARSEPVDLEVDASGQTSTIVAGEPDCLVFEPERWVALDSFGDARSVVIRNDCEASVAFATPHLRRGEGPFTFTPTTSFELAPGASQVVTVRASGNDGEREDVLFLDVVQPVPARHAITLTLP